MSYFVRAQHDGKSYALVSVPTGGDATSLTVHAVAIENPEVPAQNAARYSNREEAQAIADILNGNQAGFSWQVVESVNPALIPAVEGN